MKFGELLAMAAGLKAAPVRRRRKLGRYFEAETPRNRLKVRVTPRQRRGRRGESSTIVHLGAEIERLRAEKAETIRQLWEIIGKTNGDCGCCHDHVDAMLTRLGSKEPPVDTHVPVRRKALSVR